MYIEQGVVSNIIPTANTDADLSPAQVDEANGPLNSTFADLLMECQEEDYSSRKKIDDVSADTLMSQLTTFFLMPERDLKDEVITDDAPAMQVLNLKDAAAETPAMNSKDAAEEVQALNLSNDSPKVQAMNLKNTASEDMRLVKQSLDIQNKALPLAEQSAVDQNPDLNPSESEIALDPLNTLQLFKLLSTQTPELINNGSLDQKLEKIGDDIQIKDASTDLSPSLKSLTPVSTQEQSVTPFAENKFNLEHEKKSIVQGDNEEYVTAKSALSEDSGQVLIGKTPVSDVPNFEKHILLQPPQTKVSLPVTPYNISIEPEVLNKQHSEKVTLHINQESLGEITAKIQMINKQPVVTFTAETIEAQRALQNHVSQLKETFHESNMMLAQTHIDQNLQQRDQQAQGEKHNAYHEQQEISLIDNSRVTNKEPKTSRRINSILDTFA